jgi:hypothetical protein
LPEQRRILGTISNFTSLTAARRVKNDGEIDIGLTCGNSIGKNTLKF